MKRTIRVRIAGRNPELSGFLRFLGFLFLLFLALSRLGTAFPAEAATSSPSAYTYEDWKHSLDRVAENLEKDGFHYSVNGGKGSYRKSKETRRVTNNFDNSVRFLKLVSDEKGLNIGLRHISLSTSGLVSGIKKLKEYNLPITLSISLHAPSDDIRSSVMPVNKRWNIDELLAACKEYQAVTTRRISFEYALIDGVNNSDACADMLAKKLRGIMCHVNLIPANPVKENSFKKPDRNKILRFKERLAANGVNATVRRTLGADIDASCGQLRKRVKEGESIADIQ